MNSETSKYAFDEISNLDPDTEARQIHGKIRALCAWLQGHGAKKSDMVKHMCMEWDTVEEMRSNIKEVQNIIRFKQQASDLKLKL